MVRESTLMEHLQESLGITIECEKIDMVGSMTNQYDEYLSNGDMASAEKILEDMNGIEEMQRKMLESFEFLTSQKKEEIKSEIISFYKTRNYFFVNEDGDDRREMYFFQNKEGFINVALFIRVDSGRIYVSKEDFRHF